MVALTKNHALPARKSGKIKTVTQVVAITAVMLNFAYAWHFMILAVIITIYSGLEYLWLTRDLFKELV